MSVVALSDAGQCSAQTQRVGAASRFSKATSVISISHEKLHQFITVATVVGIPAVMLAPVARADESVTYEVVSDYITSANVEFFDGSARRSLEEVPLPWRTTVTIANPLSLSTDGAEVRADWRRAIAAPVWQPGKWVTVRIYFGETLRCQNTLDVGNAACYGSTSFKS